MNCPRCDTESSEFQQYCTACGEHLQADMPSLETISEPLIESPSAVEDQNVVQKRKSRKTPVIVCATVLVVALIGLVLVLPNSSSKKPKGFPQKLSHAQFDQYLKESASTTGLYGFQMSLTMNVGDGSAGGLDMTMKGTTAVDSKTNSERVTFTISTLGGGASSTKKESTECDKDSCFINLGSSSQNKYLKIPRPYIQNSSSELSFFERFMSGSETKIGTPTNAPSTTIASYSFTGTLDTSKIFKSLDGTYTDSTLSSGLSGILSSLKMTVRHAIVNVNSNWRIVSVTMPFTISFTTSSLGGPATSPPETIGGTVAVSPANASSFTVTAPPATDLTTSQTLLHPSGQGV